VCVAQAGGTKVRRTYGSMLNLTKQLTVRDRLGLQRVRGIPAHGALARNGAKKAAS
jgi:hypothetical protein